MPTARTLFATAVWNEKIYCIGGYRTSVSYDTEWGYPIYTQHDTAVNEVYDPATDKWTVMSSMPEPVSIIQASTVENKICVTVYGSNKLYVYNPLTDSWASKTSTPLQIASLASAVVDNRLITIGRDDNYTYYVQTYDVVTDTWSVLCDSKSNDASLNGCAVIQVNGSTNVYFFDDQYDVNPVTNIFNVENNT